MQICYKYCHGFRMASAERKSLGSESSGFFSNLDESDFAFY
jgi:hypothetical protein